MSKLSPVRLADVRLEGAFWKERLDTVLRTTIPSQHEKLGEYGMLGSLDLACRPPPPLRFPRNSMAFTVQVFWDLRRLANGSRRRATPCRIGAMTDIEAMIEAIIDVVSRRCRRPMAISIAGISIASRTTAGPICATTTSSIMPWHMLEGAIAYFQATGRRRWLDIMERYVAHDLRDLRAGPKCRSAAIAGTQEIEIALIKL